MKSRISARKRVLLEPLSALLIQKVLRNLYPKRNDYVTDMALFEELLPELARWGITTRGRLQRLMKKHRRALLNDDKSRLSLKEQRFYAELFGMRHTQDAVRRQYWFAYPAFVRKALKSEFGEAASVYERDSDPMKLNS